MDVIDHLAGLAPDSPLALIRDRKPITREQAQASYAALFEPNDTSQMSLEERFALAAFTAGLHVQDAIAAFYARTLPAPLQAAMKTEAEKARTTGPYGHYPKGPLTAEDLPGPAYTAPAPLGPRLSAAMEHVHMLVFHPRERQERSPARGLRILGAQPDGARNGCHRLAEVRQCAEACARFRIAIQLAFRDREPAVR